MIGMQYHLFHDQLLTLVKLLLRVGGSQRFVEHLLRIWPLPINICNKVANMGAKFVLRKGQKWRWTSLAGFCLAISAQAEDLGSVHAHATSNTGVDALGMPLANGTSSAWQLSAEQVARLAGPGGANPEAALGFLPGVSYNAPDA
ncbi:MAG: hypothetical protein M1346_00385 [Gammaproteobacteria bacterium]|nr:hypothetical protein [Gammaproteobacteria bacterium]